MIGSVVSLEFSNALLGFEDTAGNARLLPFPTALCDFGIIFELLQIENTVPRGNTMIDSAISYSRMYRTTYLAETWNGENERNRRKTAS